MRCTKYGGYNLTKEPHRPGPNNPATNDAKYPTVKDCRDRILHLKELVASPIPEWVAVKNDLEAEISRLEALIAEAQSKTKTYGLEALTFFIKKMKGKKNEY